MNTLKVLGHILRRQFTHPPYPPFPGEGRVSTRTGPDYKPGDMVRIDNITDEVCREFNGRHGVITHGPDHEGGWLVASAGSGLRCTAEELTMIIPREER